MPTTAPAPARTESPPLRLGPIELPTPVVLAPMAGVTNAPYRTLCRRHGKGLYVSEMVGARGLVEGDRTSHLKASFGPDEAVRSIQLYATAPEDVARAVRLLVDPTMTVETHSRYDPDTRPVDHIDLNFGCPAPKVTRHGGGAALPWRIDLYAAIVAAAVGAAGDVPVTVKIRKGIDDDHLTYLETGRIAQELGVAAVALHGRTAEERYGPPADREAIARLVDALDIPVLGNGDIWEASDALAMVAETGCAGVVVGRGCLGRPWLFRDLEAAFAGRPVPPPPDLGQVSDLIVEHAGLLVEHVGEIIGLRELRKHTGWYLQGFPVGGALRRALNQVTSVEQLRELLGRVDRAQPFDEGVRRQPRGHTDPPRRVILPEGWLDDRRSGVVLPPEAAAVVSGG